ncbi:MAG: phage tail sheath family protein [Oscillospiraceae bacterium]|nr:phage tail sheath family protein [Oscillospiraceae bacterium]
MAGGTFDKTVGKVRPGTYVNFKDESQESIKGASRGTVLLPLANTDYGPAGELITLTGSAPDAAKEKIGYSVYDTDTAGNMLLIREAFKNASTVIVYICTEGTAAASGTGGGLSATAKYKGTRGNTLTYVVEENPVSGFDVSVYLDGSKVELYEGITDATALAESAYITFTASGDLEETAGVTLTGGADGTTANADITAFLEAADNVSFNTMAFPFSDADLMSAAKTKVKYMRENEGKKVQVVVANMTSPDYEGVINVTNSYELETGKLTAVQATAFVAGITAGATYTESNTYRSVEGAIAVVDAKSHEEAVAAINAGEFFFSVNEQGTVVVEYDINSLITFADGKGETYRKNRVLRVLDSFHDSLVLNFPPNKYDNSSTGWDIMEGIGKSILKLYYEAGAIDDVDYDEDFLVDRENSAGDRTYFNVGIKPVDSAEKLFFTATTR